MNWALILAQANLAGATGETLSHPEYRVYTAITFAVVIATLLGYWLWTLWALRREEAEARAWEARRAERKQP